MLSKKYRFVIVWGCSAQECHVRIISRRNGQIIFTSETYTRKAAAVKAVKNLVDAIGAAGNLIQTVEFEEQNADGTPYVKKGGKK